MQSVVRRKLKRKDTKTISYLNIVRAVVNLLRVFTQTPATHVGLFATCAYLFHYVANDNTGCSNEECYVQTKLHAPVELEIYFKAVQS